MGDQTTVDSVTFQLQRTGDAPTGSIAVELWHDDGANHPLPVGDAGAKIADIGKVADVTELPIGSFADVAFDDLNLDLEPNNPYWIVLDYSGLSGLGEPGNSVGWGVAVDDDKIFPWRFCHRATMHSWGRTGPPLLTCIRMQIQIGSTRRRPLDLLFCGFLHDGGRSNQPAARNSR